jgi:arylsulfatase
MKSNMLRILFILFLVCLGSMNAQDKPNIVLVFLDNFGWGEPGFNGGGIIRGTETPRMDKLSNEGLRLIMWKYNVHHPDRR